MKLAVEVEQAQSVAALNPEPHVPPDREGLDALGLKEHGGL
jgi:hypothetical protein